MHTVSLSIPIPAVKGFWGDRVQTFATTIRATDLVRVLEHDPRPQKHKHLPDVTEMYKEIQRTLTAGRRNAVTQYIESRLRRDAVGAFPAISIGLTRPPKFAPFEPDGAIGHMLPASDGFRAMLDGLGRAAGTLDLGDSALGRQQLEKLTFSVVFYAPMENKEFSLADLGVLFADFNYRVNPVPQRLAMLHDTNDLYISMTRDLEKAHFIADFGGMELRAASLGKKSTAIIVQQTLVRVVRGAIEGRAAQESNVQHVSDARLTDYTYRDELAGVTAFFDGIADRMGDRWRDRNSMHLSAPGWQAMALLCHDVNHGELQLTPAEVARIQQELATFDWSRQNLSALGILAANSAGRSNKAALYSHLRRVTGVDAIDEARLPAV
jgi:hypothetical protein